MAEGKDGYGVRLTTRATGPIAQAVNKRIAAGNLFLGTFDASNALTDAMKATHFGIRFDRKPLRFEGYYKYAPGEVFQNQDGSIIAGKVDQGTIYAIFYRNTDEQGSPLTLYGDNVQTSKYIVAKAIVPHIETTDEWTHFSIDFDYSGNEIDPIRLAQFGYSLAIVCSSSVDGAYFQGAVGSTLCIDAMTLTCEKELLPDAGLESKRFR